MRAYRSVGYKRRHYEDIARILGECDNVAGIVIQFVQLLACDNPRFDRQRFEAAIARHRASSNTTTPF